MTFLESLADFGQETFGGIGQSISETLGGVIRDQRAALNERLGITRQTLTDAQEQAQQAAVQQQSAPQNSVMLFGREFTTNQLLVGGGVALGVVLLISRSK